MRLKDKYVTLGVALLPLSLFAQKSERPNILVIQCDQFAKRAVGAYGEVAGVTPVLDSLASQGVVFNNAYVGSPLSQPSRSALWTGMTPHEVDVRSNSAAPINPTVSNSITTLGELFTGAGYDAIHFGKMHEMGALRGFECVELSAERFSDENYPVNQDSFLDVVTTRNAVEYLSGKKEGDDPFICVVDLINPHNICGYIGAYRGAYEDSSSVPYIKGELPELPDNFEVNNWENLPKTVQYLCCTHPRLAQAAHWSDLQYRHYVAAYYYYCEMVCKQIEQVLAALHSTDAGENTIVVFLADHGDGLASHRMVSKQASFYEEITNVPLIFAGKGIKKQEDKVQELSCITMDLLPTLCGLAGIEVPDSKRGVNWAPLLEESERVKGHDYVVSEWHSEYEYAVNPGRMLRSKDFKYMHYVEDNGEELYDMRSDRGEKFNLSKDSRYKKALNKHRKLLKEYTVQTNDDYYSLESVVDARCRSHKVGYQNHTGADAREYAQEKLWKVVFEDSGVDTDWSDKWFLDGDNAKVTNGADGISFKSGVHLDGETKSDAYHSNHAVLWTKDSFDDGVRIKYDFMRTDTHDDIGVVLLYLLAEGYEEGGFDTDIYAWRNERTKPYMKYYFNNMTLAHISYATHDDEGSEYIRSRVYPRTPEMDFSELEITPSYESKDLFKPFEWYSIEAIKLKDEIKFIVNKDGKQYMFLWNDPRIKALKSGRIGLRQMTNRSSNYRNIQIFQRAE